MNFLVGTTSDAVDAVIAHGDESDDKQIAPLGLLNSTETRWKVLPIESQIHKLGQQSSGWRWCSAKPRWSFWSVGCVQSGTICQLEIGRPTQQKRRWLCANAVACFGISWDASRSRSQVQRFTSLVRRKSWWRSSCWVGLMQISHKQRQLLSHRETWKALAQSGAGGKWTSFLFRSKTLEA